MSQCKPRTTVKSAPVGILDTPALRATRSEASQPSSRGDGKKKPRASSPVHTLPEDVPDSELAVTEDYATSSVTYDDFEDTLKLHVQHAGEIALFLQNFAAESAANVRKVFDAPTQRLLVNSLSNCNRQMTLALTKLAETIAPAPNRPRTQAPPPSLQANQPPSPALRAVPIPEDEDEVMEPTTPLAAMTVPPTAAPNPLPNPVPRPRTPDTPTPAVPAPHGWETVTPKQARKPAAKPTPAESKPTVSRVPPRNRVVVHIRKSAHYVSQFAGHSKLVEATQAINRAIERDGKPWKCLGVRRSSGGNLLVAYPNSTSRKDVGQTFQYIRNALLLPADVRLSYDGNWSFMSIANVPTRAPGAAQPYSQLELLTALRANPAFKDLTYTRSPSWVTDPTKLTKARSTISFAFDDPSGKLLPRLFQEDVYLFESAVSLKSWSPKKPAAKAPPET